MDDIIQEVASAAKPSEALVTTTNAVKRPWKTETTVYLMNDAMKNDLIK